MRKMLVSSFLLVFLFFAPRELFPQSKSLDWQLQFLKEKTNESMPINKIIGMKTGDGFNLVIKADDDCYCYVFIYDSEQNIYVWYNQAVEKGSETPLDTLDLAEPSGTETIYVIVSSSRQAELEKLITQFNNSSSSQNTSNLYREIMRLQDTASGRGEPGATVIPSGGTTKGLDDGGFATKFTGKELYVRAIGIRH